MIITVLKVLLWAALAIYGVIFFKDFFKAKKEGRLEEEAIWKPIVTGFVTNFGDTLGIGSFAPTVFLFKLFKHNIRDKQYPATLNAADTFPVLCEAIIFISATKVDPVTLVVLIAAAVVGSYLGAGFIARQNEKTIQIIMGIALLVSAFLFFMTLPGIDMIPAAGTAYKLTTGKLITSAVLFFVFGALMTAGIGLYAPAMIVVNLMGMHPMAAFPIMMGSCALLMPVASMKFLKEDSFAKKNAMIIGMSGIAGVFVAAKIVKSLPVDKLKILVIIVVLITAFQMLHAAFKKKEA